MSSATKVAGGKVTVYDDEELLHDIQPSFVESITYLDIVLTILTVGLWLIVPYRRRENTRYVITSNRLINMKGSLFGSSTKEFQFKNMEDIRMNQGLLTENGIEFTMRREGRGHENITLPLEGVSNFESVKETIRKRQYEASRSE